MRDQTDFIVKKGRKTYRHHCDACASDMGYIRPSKQYNPHICRPCSYLNKNIPDNVDITDFNDEGRNRLYRVSCIQCNEDRGYKLIHVADRRCRRCTQSKHDSVLQYPGVDRDRHMGSEIENRRLYSFTCITCNAHRGYQRLIKYGMGKCNSCANSYTHSGKIVSDESRKRISDWRKDYFKKHPERHPWLGRKHTKAAIEKLSKAATAQCRKYGGIVPYDGIHGNIGMRSGWEVKYAKYLDEHNIGWEYEPEGFKLSSGRTYIPDFQLDNGVIIEIKGWWRDDAKIKWDLFIKEYPHVTGKVLMKKDLQQMGVI